MESIMRYLFVCAHACVCGDGYTRRGCAVYHQRCGMRSECRTHIHSILVVPLHVHQRAFLVRDWKAYGAASTACGQRVACVLACLPCEIKFFHPVLKPANSDALV